MVNSLQQFALIGLMTQLAALAFWFVVDGYYPEAGGSKFLQVVGV
jgi:hypothetical protein